MIIRFVEAAHGSAPSLNDLIEVVYLGDDANYRPIASASPDSNNTRNNHAGGRSKLCYFKLQLKLKLNLLIHYKY